MEKILQLFRKSITLAAILFFSVAPVFPASAQEAFEGPCVGTSYKNVDASTVPTIQGLECLVGNILASAITLIGIVAFVMFLVGGFQYLTAGNNSKGVEQGKNSITFAIVGIVVALASILILNVIAGLTGVRTILQFRTQSDSQTQAR